MGKTSSSRAWHPRIIAHRGGAAEIGLPENSLAAFLAASQAGFQSECDVWASSDGEAVVIHDQTLDRMTTATGNVAAYNVSQLRQTSLCDPAGGVATIPMLGDVARFIELVEIKPANARPLVGRIIQIMAGKVWTLMAFDESNLHHARQFDPAVQVAFLVKDLPGVDAAISGRWPVCIDQALLEKEIMRRFRDAGLFVGTWTVDTREQLQRILPLQPDLIISNMPMRMRQWINEQIV